MAFLGDDILRMNIIINGDNARVEFNKLQEKVSELRRETEKLAKTALIDKNALSTQREELGKQLTQLQKDFNVAPPDLAPEMIKQMKEVQRQFELTGKKIEEIEKAQPLFQKKAQELSVLNTQMEEARRKIDLTSMSMRELRKYATELEIEKSVTGDPDIIKKYNTELQTVKDRITVLRSGLSELKKEYDINAISANECRVRIQFLNEELNKTAPTEGNKNRIKELKNEKKLLTDQANKLKYSLTDLNETFSVEGKSIEQLQQRAKSLEVEMKRIDPNSGKWKSYDQELSVVRAEIDKFTNKLHLLDNEFNVNTASVKELNDRLNMLKTAITTTNPNTNKFADYQTELQKVSERYDLLTKHGYAFSHQLEDLGRATMNELTQRANAMTAALNNMNPKTEQYRLFKEELDRVNKQIETNKYNLSDLDKTFDIVSSSMNELKNRANLLEIALKDMSPNDSQFNKMNLELNSVNRRIEELKLGTEGWHKNFDMTTASITQLEERAILLNLYLKNANPDVENLKTYRDEIERVIQRMNELQTGTSRTRAAFDKWASNLNEYQTLFQMVAVGIYGIVQGVKNMASSMGESADQMGEVIKTTDLTATEVAKLKSSFKSFDTRTATGALMDLSKVAGQLGIRGLNEIKSFTRGANVFVTALTGDLSGSAEEITKTMGKIISAFRMDKIYGWDTSIKKLGSVINELGKYNASPDAIIQYMSRLSSTAVAAKITSDQIAALGATLDSLKVPAEMGSTAVGKFIFTLGENATEFARMLNISEKQYKAMLNYDLMGTMVKVLEITKSGKGGLMNLINSMDAVDASGVRMAGTIGTLQNNIDNLKSKLAIAHGEFGRGTSMLNEYNTMNNNFAGEMAKAQKKVEAVTGSIMLKLQPAILGITKFIAYLATTIGSLVRFVGYLTLAYVANIATGKILSSQNGLIASTFNGIDNAITKMKNGFIAMAKELWKNPWGLVITGAAMLAEKLISLYNESQKYNKLRKELNEAEAETTHQIKLKKMIMTEEFEELKRSNPETERRTKILERLNAKYPELLNNYNLEKASLEEINRVQKEVMANMENKIRLDLREGQYKQTVEEVLKAEDAYNAAVEKAKKTMSTVSPVGGGYDFKAAAEAEANEAYKNLTKAKQLRDEFYFKYKKAKIDANEFDEPVADKKEEPENDFKGEGKKKKGSSKMEKEKAKDAKDLEQLKQQTAREKIEMLDDGIEKDYLKLLLEYSIKINEFNQKLNDAEKDKDTERQKALSEMVGVTEKKFRLDTENLLVKYDTNYKKDLTEQDDILLNMKYMNEIINPESQTINPDIFKAGKNRGEDYNLINTEEKKKIKQPTLASINKSIYEAGDKKTEMYNPQQNNNKEETNIKLEKNMFDNAIRDIQIKQTKLKEAKPDTDKRKKEVEKEKIKQEKDAEVQALWDDFDAYQAESLSDKEKELFKINADYNKKKSELDKQLIQFLSDPKASPEQKKKFSEYVELYKQKLDETLPVKKQEVEQKYKNKDDKEFVKKINKFAEEYKGFESQTSGAINAMRDAQIAKIDAEEARVKKRYKAEMDMANLTQAQKDALQKKQDAELEKLEEKKKQLNKKYALYDILRSISEIAVNTAVGISAATKNPATAPFVIPLIIAQGVAQTIKAKAEYDKVKQAKEGLYPVIGEDDNQLYFASIKKTAETEISYRPTLISEKGPEAVIDNQTLYSKKRDSYGWTAANYYNQILKLAGKTPQAATGLYPKTEENKSLPNSQNQDIIAKLNELIEVSKRETKARVTIKDIDEQYKLQDNINKITSLK